jgi:hypothetical protein
MFGKIKLFYKTMVPLVTDTDPAGNRKGSLGRLVAFAAAACILYIFIKFNGQDPGPGILSLFGTAMAYNGFSKTPLAGGNGGESIVIPRLGPPAKKVEEQKQPTDAE